jgi:ABC-type enterochelin transport system permease subunit
VTFKQRHLCIAAILLVLALCTPSMFLGFLAAALALGNLACAAHEEAEERW